MKRLLIDANPVVPYFVSGHVSGIGRTTKELIEALAKVPDLPFEIMLYSQNMKGIGGRNLDVPFKNRHLYLPNRGPVNKVLSHLPVREWLARYDIMHITHNFEYVAHPEKCIVTLHDAMFYSYPEDFFNCEFARQNYYKLARKAKAIITCSENSKREILEYMNVPEEKISVIPWGVNRNLLYPHEVKTNKWSGSEPYFTSVSCDRGRKNTINLLKAYREFAKDIPLHHLILVWRNPTPEALELADKSELKGKVHFASNLSNEELADIYAGATASFFPSRYEGFGLPILESMACGTPVVTCANSCLPEVGGEAAIYVDPDDTVAMRGWMEKFESGSIDMNALVKKSILQAEKFTWERCALETIEVYKKCLDL